jgi:cellulose synthase/poly-beta-1,6-N-acetylglucosamine synthase-like glycosyltransferase
VLIPARNEERAIAGSITSLLASRGVKIEILVLDDGSTEAGQLFVAGEQSICACLGAALDDECHLSPLFHEGAQKLRNFKMSISVQAAAAAAVKSYTGAADHESRYQPSRIPPFAKNAKDGAPAFSWCFLPCQTPTAA